jgi:MFS family permease
MSNEERASSGLTKQETRDSLRSFNIHALCRNAFETICGGTTFIFVAFALALGLPKERMGLITTAVSSACVAQMVGLAALGRVRDKKRVVLFLAAAEPAIMILAVLLVPFLPPGMRIAALMAAALTAAASVHLTRPVMEEWLASTIPANLRSRYLGRRFILVGVVVIAATLLAGQSAEWFGPGNIHVLSLILAAGGCFGILAVIPLSRITLPAISNASRVDWADIRQVVRHREFLRYQTAIVVYNLPFFLAVPYYQVFNLRVLGLSEGTVGTVWAGYFLVKTVMYSLAARLNLVFGARALMIATGPLYALFFLCLALSTPDRIWPVFVGWALAGPADALFILAQTASLYDAIPHTPSRPAYFAAFNLSQLGLYAVGALVGMKILEGLRGVECLLGPIALEQFQTFFLGCGIAMLICALSPLLLSRAKPT